MLFLSGFKHLYAGLLLFVVLFGTLSLANLNGSKTLIEKAWAACPTAGTSQASDGNCYSDPANKRGYFGPATADTTTTTTTKDTTSGCDVFCTLGKIVGFFTTDLGKLIGGDDGIIANILKAFTHILGGQASAITPNSPPRTVAEIYNRYGALGALGVGIQQMYDNPPITTADYLATLHPITPAYAEVSGRDVLKPVLLFWTASRNLAYIFFVLILVTIGLMVMFRSKIDPRTTVSVTAALPGLVVSLVLITFSLAFAGLLIDVGRLFMELAKGFLQGSISGGVSLLNPGRGVDLSTGSIWSSFVFNGNNGVSFGGFGGALVGFFVQLVIMVFAIIVGIQVFIMLLFRYINLLVKPIFAPFVFLFGALPGRGGSMTSWFKGYLIDALTFPAVFLILNLALAIKETTNIAQGDPFGVFLADANINSLMAIGIVFLATKVPAMLEEAFDVKPSSHVDRAGAQPSSMAKSVPILKNFL